MCAKSYIGQDHWLCLAISSPTPHILPQALYVPVSSRRGPSSPTRSTWACSSGRTPRTTIYLGTQTGARSPAHHEGVGEFRGSGRVGDGMLAEQRQKPIGRLAFPRAQARAAEISPEAGWYREKKPPSLSHPRGGSRGENELGHPDLPREEDPRVPDEHAEGPAQRLDEPHAAARLHEGGRGRLPHGVVRVEGPAHRPVLSPHLGELQGEGIGVLDRLVCALPEKGGHGVAGVAQEHHPLAPARAPRRHRVVEAHPQVEESVAFARQAAHLWREVEALEGGERLPAHLGRVPVGVLVPRGLCLHVLAHGDDVVPGPRPPRREGEGVGPVAEPLVHLLLAGPHAAPALDPELDADAGEVGRVAAKHDSTRCRADPVRSDHEVELLRAAIREGGHNPPRALLEADQVLRELDLGGGGKAARQQLLQLPAHDGSSHGSALVVELVRIRCRG
mmetsp:Transcript_56982/g.180303  ORF Transcript_56982/g.180303 Transcript_56982/m.180303 type:complete len:448 (-) Transcript_56982:475-1818(-)